MTPAAFPQAFAVGSRIGISISTTSSNDGNPVLQPVSTEYLTPSLAAATTFNVVKQGFGGIYATSTVDSTFIDYTLLRLVDVGTLAIGDAQQSALGPTTSLDVGDSLTFTALPEADGVLLAGALDLEWSISDATVIALNTANPTARVAVGALKSGTATLTVTLAGMHAATTLTVP